MKYSRTVDSSNVQELEYDDEKHELVVTFKGGVRYRYDGVRKDAFDDLVAAPSVGKHLAAYIKNDYPAARLRDR